MLSTAVAAGQHRLPSYLALECMVQTVAAMVGLKRRSQGLNPLVGLILGSRKCRFFNDYLPVEGELDIYIETLMVEEPLGVFSGSVCAGGTELVVGQIKAIQPRNQTQLEALLGESQ